VYLHNECTIPIGVSYLDQVKALAMTNGFEKSEDLTDYISGFKVTVSYCIMPKSSQSNITLTGDVPEYEEGVQYGKVYPTDCGRTGNRPATITSVTLTIELGSARTSSIPIAESQGKHFSWTFSSRQMHILGEQDGLLTCNGSSSSNRKSSWSVSAYLTHRCACHQRAVWKLPPLMQD
jgi:hypothetical protein